MKTRILPPLVIVLVLLAQSMSCKSVRSSLAVFSPDADSPFKIIFSYPDNWEWFSPPNSTTRTFGVISVFDPYPATNPELPEEQRFISIRVGVDSHPRYSIQEYIALFLQEPLRFEVLSNGTLGIDGHDAQWVTIRRPLDLAAAEAYIDATFIEEHIFLLGDDRYYVLILRIPEDELNGRFHTEFKAMVESIKILP